jgi:cobalt-precorrin 5A hydrolase
MKTAVVSLSAKGAQVGNQLLDQLEDCAMFVHVSAEWSGPGCRFQRLKALVGSLFRTSRAIVFVAPCGAVVRAIAPHLRHKKTDPAVVVLDVGARHVVSLLSGHEGGANELAVTVANALGAEPVVTTTTDAAKDLIVGIGCRRKSAAERIVTSVESALAEVNASLKRVRTLASVDLKADEAGLWAAARVLGVPLRLISAEEIRSTRKAFARSPVAERRLDLPAVAEPTALLAGRRTTLLLPKRVYAGVTVAVARESLPWSASDPAVHSTVPIGPSKPSPRAR